MRQIYLRVHTQEQWNIARTWKGASVLIADAGLVQENAGDATLLLPGDCGADPADTGSNAAQVPAVYVSLPDIMREGTIRRVKEITSAPFKMAGVVVKNPDELGVLLENGFSGEIAADASLYAYNSQAAGMYLEDFPGMLFIGSDELTDRELQQMEAGGSLRERIIYKAYGYPQLMVSAQCISRNYTGCREKVIPFRDEKGESFYAVSDCSTCSSRIYLGKPVYMLDRLNEIPYERVLLDFTLEDGEQMRHILQEAQAAMETERTLEPPRAFTRGHHYTGIE